MYNYCAVVEYDGTNFKGFQKQRVNVRTVQSELEKAIKTLTGNFYDFTYAGRTDSGVHAKHQVISFKVFKKLDLYKFKWQFNNVLPEDIAIKEIKNVDLNFNSRKDAVLREYSYYVVNNNWQSVFLKKYSIMICQNLDIKAMRLAAEKFIGIKDFKAFSNFNLKNIDLNSINDNTNNIDDNIGDIDNEDNIDNKDSKDNIVGNEIGSGTQFSRIYTVRHLYYLKIKKYSGNLIVFKIAANSFLYNMVRIIVGTLLEIGKGIRSIESIEKAFKTRDRKDAGKIVPAKGLFLTKVLYS